MLFRSWVRTRTWTLEDEAGRAVWPGMAEPIRFDLPEGILIKHSANTALTYHAGRLLALMEATVPYELRASTLETVGVWDYEGTLRSPFTAHPKIDPVTGHLHFFGYWFFNPFLTYSVADASGRVISSEPVDVRQTTMMHSFAITERDVVFWECPVLFSIEEAMAGALNPFHWDPS